MCTKFCVVELSQVIIMLLSLGLAFSNVNNHYKCVIISVLEGQEWPIFERVDLAADLQEIVMRHKRHRVAILVSIMGITCGGT